MNLMRMIRETDLGVTPATFERKLEYLLRRTAFIEANSLLKRLGKITRFKGLLDPNDFFSEKYDKLVYKFYNILFSEFKDRLNSHGQANESRLQVRIQKNRGRKSLTLHIPFRSNEVAVAFQSDFPEALPTDRLGQAWSRPLVYYNSFQAILNYEFGCSNFYPQPFASLPDQARAGLNYQSLPAQLGIIEELFCRLNTAPDTLNGSANEDEVSSIAAQPVQNPSTVS